MGDYQEKNGLACNQTENLVEFSGQPEIGIDNNYNNTGNLFTNTDETQKFVRGTSTKSSSNCTSNKNSDTNSANSWWRPWAVFALSVQQTLVCVGEWAWDRTLESSVGGVVKTIQHKTSDVYESVKYRSSVAAQDCQEAASSFYEDLNDRLSVSIFQGTYDRMLHRCTRCKQNVELALLEAKLKLNLATNRAQLKSDTIKLDAKKRFSEHYDELVSGPVLAVRSKLRSAGSQTSGQVNKCTSRLACNLKGNLNALSLKAKECEDDFDEIFPKITSKSIKKSEETVATKCQMVKVADPAPHLHQQ